MYLLGLDIGTTGTKAVLCDDFGNIVSKGYSSYPLIANGANVEQDADCWVTSSIKAINQVLADHQDKLVEAISLSTQGASTVAVDCNYCAVAPALTWMDFRSIAEAEEIRTLLGDEYVYKMSGWKTNATLDAAKIRHMKKLPAFASAAKYLTTLEYVNYFLTGNAVIDPSNASIRQLYNIRRSCWDSNMLNAVGLSLDELPQVIPTGVCIGHITHEAANATGLRQGTPVINGAHDQYCASIGANALTPGDVLLGTGTTWALLAISASPLFSPSFIAPGVHPVSGLYGAMASINGAGVSLEWLKTCFFPNLNWEQINNIAAEANDTDLFFYPYLSGANYPLWDLSVRGSFNGMMLEHRAGHFVRAVMEGVVFAACGALDDFEKNGINVSGLKVIGGATNSKLWTEILSDASGQEIQLLSQPDACAIGAAIIAGYGVGVYSSLAQGALSMVKFTEAKTPNLARSEYYKNKQTRYRDLWNVMNNTNKGDHI